MALCDKDIVPGEVLPVVVIGNGPSGICLSYLLSGYAPYLQRDAWHPNPLLSSKLGENTNKSLLEQDLEYLCEGLEGRSTNPVAVLFDSLLLPDSDFGLDHASPLSWRYEPERATPHLVLGRGPPGGAWHAMEGSMLTLSLANWMELPGLKLKEWLREKRRNLRNDRATPAEIASYYQHYVTQMSLGQSFACGTTVTALTWQPGREGEEPCWRVTGQQRSEGEELEDGHTLRQDVPFSISAQNVVLATGTHDIPARLEVEGETLPYVCHSFWELEAAISRGELSQSSDPILVVGAGLTAADAVLAAHHLNTPVYHAFRRSVTDPGLIFNQLPKLLYPEYHKVHQMMSQQQHSSSPQAPTTALGPSGSAPYTGYLSFPRHRVVAFRPDRKCVLESDSGQRSVLQVSMALVLIGSHPNLSFLPEGGRSLSLDPDQPISCRRNPLEVDPFTHQVVGAEGPGLYAMGPLVGENFVRFLKGGALAIASDLSRKQRGEGSGAELSESCRDGHVEDRQTETCVS
ncbi:oxidative stress induced growth inhibitor 1 [Gadus chalcogrammus]|uniref:oxidative stress induced growth inhibitor 1 n=1 Tax=Gadus chalcogrammus TaxID=1042646 RepID=UPI0024C48933|nr:oxidative stress induced growth inhibitor 1 [Gadus chalcogrammus]